MIFLKFIGAYSVEVVCRNKKDGKQRASQKMLAKLHPGMNFYLQYFDFMSFFTFKELRILF